MQVAEILVRERVIRQAGDSRLELGSGYGQVGLAPVQVHSLRQVPLRQCRVDRQCSLGGRFCEREHILAQLRVPEDQPGARDAELSVGSGEAGIERHRSDELRNRCLVVVGAVERPAHEAAPDCVVLVGLRIGGQARCESLGVYAGEVNAQLLRDGLRDLGLHGEQVAGCGRKSLPTDARRSMRRSAAPGCAVAGHRAARCPRTAAPGCAR